MSAARFTVAALLGLALAVPARAQDADSVAAPAITPLTATPDSAAAAPAGADSTANSTAGAAADSLPAVPPWTPDPSWEALTWFRPERSADVASVRFGTPDDPVPPVGFASLAGILRLQPGVRTREMSQGPTAETFDLSGAGSDRSALLRPGSSLALPGTSGPQSHEAGLGELDGVAIVRGGAAALYGPEAVDGAVLALASQPLPEELLTRASAEEGVDDWQRGAFKGALRLGSSAGLFAATESRRLEGFFPGTKEVDRLLDVRLAGRIDDRTQGRLEYRIFKGDGRMGGFEFDTIRSVLTKREDMRAELFRATSAGGALVEANLTRAKLETGVGGADVETRKFLVPSLRVTADVPFFRGFPATARIEGSNVRVQREEADETDSRLRGAAALRITRHEAAAFATLTVRADADEGRPLAPHVRLEAEAPRGRAVLFAILSRGERLPDPDAASPDDAEVHLSATLGARVRTGPVAWRAAGFATNVDDARREPTFEEVRARRAVLDAPYGDAEIRGASAGLDTDRFPFPGAPGIGTLLLRTSVTALSARDVTADTRLPRRPALTWTGEGYLEKRLFSGELAARVRGRLTHERDRVDDAGAPVADAWLTDVILEGEVGDAVFFYRFMDLMERADEIEPGIRLPGFSRMWGLTWRFTG